MEAWNPVLEVPVDGNVVAEVMESFGRVVDLIEDRKFSPPGLEVLKAPSRPDGKVPFSQDVCLNCDARFGCASYRQLVRAQSPGRADQALRDASADFGGDAEKQDWRDSGVTATARIDVEDEGTSMKPEKIERRPSIEERLDVLRDLLPEVFTDGRVNVERLREVLEDSASDAPDNEHYGLRWPGKQQARRLANQPPHVTLRPVPKAGVDEETTGNMVIVGDNLQVLLALQKSYAGTVKLIYIDPPYNTGNDFVYNDTFAVDEDAYLLETRQADLEGRLVSNPQTNGRFHSNWLTMMYPRLRVARTTPARRRRNLRLNRRPRGCTTCVT